MNPIPAEAPNWGHCNRFDRRSFLEKNIPIFIQLALEKYVFMGFSPLHRCDPGHLSDMCGSWRSSNKHRWRPVVREGNDGLFKIVPWVNVTGTTVAHTFGWTGLTVYLAAATQHCQKTQKLQKFQKVVSCSFQCFSFCSQVVGADPPRIDNAAGQVVTLTCILAKLAEFREKHQICGVFVHEILLKSLWHCLSWGVDGNAGCPQSATKIYLTSEGQCPDLKVDDVKGRSCVNIWKSIGEASGKVKILPMMAHNLWPAVQERPQRSMDAMIFKVQFIVVSHHGLFDLFYHFWFRWTHWSSPFWYWKHGGMMWDVWPRTVYQPVANTQAIQFDASTLQVGDLYDLCRCLRFFTTSFVHRRCTVLPLSSVTHSGNLHQFCSRCGPWWYSDQLGIWQFQRETLRHRTDFYCSCAVLAAPRMLKVMLVLVGLTWPCATHSKWHMTSKANCGSCQRSVCCLRLYFWLYWK